jgi:hypothetical protein
MVAGYNAGLVTRAVMLGLDVAEAALLEEFL